MPLNPLVAVRLKRALRSALPIAFAAVGSFALAVIGTAVDGWPLPRSHDEFSYLLAAETFASGRLANEAHPLSDALETMHVLHQPSYSSKYLPGHGLSLALGIALGGGPRLGQWLAFAFMGAAVYWMLTGWLSRRGAATAAGLFMLILADTDWVTGYWGSSLAVAGSALIFGAIRRLEKGPATRLGIFIGIGAVLLALTRPAEGLAVSVFPAAWLLWWIFSSPEREHRLLRVGLPSALMLALGATLLGAHNGAVTGNKLRLAYAEYEETAAGAPPFIWQSVKAAQGELRPTQQTRLRHDLGSYTTMRNQWRSAMWSRAKYESLPYYLPDELFAAVFLVLPFALRNRRLWLLVASAAAVGVVIAVSSYYTPRYLGPALPPLLILYAVCCGAIARLRSARHRIGRATVAGLTSALGVLAVYQLFSHSPLERALTLPEHWTRQRAAIEQRLDSLAGRHVVFVRYAPTYRSLDEWVQNGPDLTRTPILWAHDLGEAPNAVLLEFEADRIPWLLTVHGRGRPVELQRYAAPVVEWRTFAGGASGAGGPD